jgi:hypothetical protein
VKREREVVARSTLNSDSPARLRPLAQRVLENLPGPPALWLAAWALVPWLNAAANLLLESGERSAVTTPFRPRLCWVPGQIRDAFADSAAG